MNKITLPFWSLFVLLFNNSLSAKNEVYKLKKNEVYETRLYSICIEEVSQIGGQLHDSDSLPKRINRIQILPTFLEETSGLCETAEGIWSINDSQNPSELFLLQRVTYVRWRDSGISISEKDFVIFELSYPNTDWEAIESDGENLYIGDFGNNRGNRNDLKIIKISVDSLKKRIDDSSPHKQRIDCKSFKGEIIAFSYKDQKDFNIRRLHNFDCEAMVLRDTTIVLLSKNWRSLTCDVYEVPKILGSYSLSKSGSFNPRFLVTDATEAHGKIYFCGYGPSGKQYIGEVNSTNFKKCKRKKLPIKPAQIEGIHFDKSVQQIILSTESRKQQKQALMILGE